jgi:ribosomal protein L13
MLSETEKKRLMRRLKIFNDQNHFHAAQNPIELNISDIYSNAEIFN